MEHNLIFASETEADTAGYEALLGAVITAALEAERVTVPCEVDILFTDNAGMQEINREQRGVDASTDVLSFPMFEWIPGQPPTEETAETDPATDLLPLGDMVLNLDRAKEQAAEYGHSLRRELAYLTVHSVLHLLGYDHLDDGPQQRQMRAREEAILGALGISRDGQESASI